MAINSKYVVSFRRKIEGKTDYKKRMNLLKSDSNRVIVRLKNNSCVVQLVKYDETGDKTLLNVNSIELKKVGWNNSLGNLPAAYLTGYMFGKKALKMGLKEGIFDLGMRSIVKGSRLVVLMKGVIDSGFEVPADIEEYLPTEDRIKGVHIAQYSQSKDLPKGQFNKIKSKSIDKDFEEVKKKL
ncbi:MAG: 50S ribosomal protein L18 [Candidatus Nanoarchaeia archaeon]|nr:50S ribosomal protein L18 [Candidatus Nanoarchaeia archaeon]